jgi:hypothetical protein
VAFGTQIGDEGASNKTASSGDGDQVVFAHS